MSRPLALIAEDDLVARGRICGLVHAAGLQPLAVGDGQAAWRQLGASRPAVLITDLQMPRLSGRALVRRVRADAALAELPILVVTSETSPAARIELLEMGVDDYLSKPVDADELRVRLKGLVRRGRLVLELQEVRAERDEAWRRLQRKKAELERLTFGLLNALERANTVFASDRTRFDRLASYARLLGRLSGCDELLVEQLGAYAGLHDVGNVGIRPELLRRPGELTDEERLELQDHTLIGGEFLNAVGLPRVAVNIARAHHERWDGQGYPHRLTGEDIPLEARIVAAVDAFDHLRWRRSHKPSFRDPYVGVVMNQLSGQQLDPALVALLLENQDEIDRLEGRFVVDPDGEEFEAADWAALEAATEGGSPT